MARSSFRPEAAARTALAARRFAVATAVVCALAAGAGPGPAAAAPEATAAAPAAPESSPAPPPSAGSLLRLLLAQVSPGPAADGPPDDVEMDLGRLLTGAARDAVLRQIGSLDVDKVQEGCKLLRQGQAVMGKEMESVCSMVAGDPTGAVSVAGTGNYAYVLTSQVEPDFSELSNYGTGNDGTQGGDAGTANAGRDDGAGTRSRSTTSDDTVLAVPGPDAASGLAALLALAAVGLARTRTARTARTGRAPGR